MKRSAAPDFGTSPVCRVLGAVLLVVLTAFLGACGGSSGGFVPPDPFIQLFPTGTGAYASPPVAEMLDTISNDGLGYTGEVDHFTIEAPDAGRLQISVAWEQEANIDIIVSRDADARDRIAEGLISGFEPEYVGFPVVQGQVVHVFVAGWTGTPGDYTLETLLLPTDAPEFGLLDPPALEDGHPANRPLDFVFNVELQPDQDLAGTAILVGAGHLAEGEWCIDRDRLRFLPRLPAGPGDPGGLRPGDAYTLQFARAANGIRAVSGEYLNDVIQVSFDAIDPVEEAPGEPLSVTGTSPSPGQPATDGEILLAFNEPLDPDRLDVRLVQFDPSGDGTRTPLDFTFALTQFLGCNGSHETRITIAPQEAIDPGSIVGVVVGEQTRSLTGKPLNGAYEAAFAYTSGG